MVSCAAKLCRGSQDDQLYFEIPASRGPGRRGSGLDGTQQSRCKSPNLSSKPANIRLRGDPKAQQGGLLFMIELRILIGVGVGIERRVDRLGQQSVRPLW